ncbi:MAG: arginine N-succinyltransferase, partial [Gammaproteobacteria bacterium]
MTAETPPNSPVKGRFDWLHVSLITVLVIIVSVLVTLWVIKTYIFPTEFEPVTLSSSEQQVLDKKIEALEFDSTGRLNPEKYSELGAERKVAFSEKELNALVASNTDL